MTTVLWLALAVLIYMTGFTVTLAWKLRKCKHKADNHVWYNSYYGIREKNECNHVWEDPLVPFWPACLALGIVVAPFWLMFGGATKTAHKLAEWPTREERAAAREKAAALREQERNTERKQLRKRVHELEDELGYPRSVFDSVKEKQLT